jgi:hypothetical protein
MGDSKPAWNNENSVILPKMQSVVNCFDSRYCYANFPGRYCECWWLFPCPWRTISPIAPIYRCQYKEHIHDWVLSDKFLVHFGYGKHNLHISTHVILSYAFFLKVLFTGIIHTQFKMWSKKLQSTSMNTLWLNSTKFPKTIANCFVCQWRTCGLIHAIKLGAKVIILLQDSL